MTTLRYFRRILLALSLLGPTLAATAQTSSPATGKIKLYIVGTFHFSGSTSDVVKGTKTDMNTPEKQREVEEVIDRLQKTQADKVFIEWQPTRQHFVDSTYALYRQNQFTLGNNEVYQVGYRLAKKLNRPRVYCADADGVFNYTATQAYAKQHGQEQILKDTFAETPQDSVGRLLAARKKKATPENPLPGNTLLAQFARMNTKAADQGNMDVYLLELARVGGGPNYVGADLAGEFFKRNVRIYNNLLRTVDVQRDKSIVLLIGQGHVAFLKSILQYNSLFEVQDVLPLLTSK
ncbi:DUF5694 domain-containing protein [Hymenobacter aerilatus]|uniref:DUF5694 domain-containing protein n=1 Tax=Hymenobacter aerilatus TaxID=2932251 RepID=A0A8T9SSK3_9BACT|nr:DUF5694 domain-containing protein [Hymenobacter aerilatus]UOR05118.1 DUF5694 domain-containing protein [Hymenobacter aerilatus]